MSSTEDTRAVLATAVDRLYTAFAAYPYRPAMPVCDHCVSVEEVVRLSGEVRTLPAAAFEPYGWKALTTWGEVDDLRHLLPRMLELMTQGSLGVPAPVVSSKLRSAGWSQWPVAEQSALSDFLEAWWLTTVTTRSPPIDLVTCLAALDLAGDIEPYLEGWHIVLGTETPDREAALWHLVETVRRLRPVAQPSSLRRFCWGESGSETRLAGWLTGETTVIELERATFDFAGSSLAEAAANALARLTGR